MKKNSSISNIIPSWMKFKKVAEPIRVRKIRDILEDLVKDEPEADSKIERVISIKDKEKENQVTPPVETEPEVRDNTRYIKTENDKKDKPSVLEKLQNRITSVSDDLESNLDKNNKNSEKNAENSEKIDKNTQNFEKIDNDIEISERENVPLYSKNSDSDLDEPGKSKSLEDFEKQIQKIQDSYKDKTDYDYYKDLLPEIKDNLGLSTLDDIEIDEDELRKEITNRLTKKSDEQKNKLKADTENSITKLAKSLEDEKQNAFERQEELSKVYDDAKENVSMDALKRGLQRSSIVLQSIAQLDSKKAEELIGVQKKLQETLNEGSNKIKSLEQFLDQSLANEDTELVSEIESELASEIEKLKEKQQEIEKFNNNVKKLEAEYQLKIADKRDEAREFEKKLSEEYKGVASKNRKNEIVEACKEYFKSKTKSEALNDFYKSETLKNVLGDRYYDVYYYITKNCK